MAKNENGKIVVEVEMEEEAEVGATEENDMETFVRQTRQTFGITLPENYLSTEEYLLYRRFYGQPIRTTVPEDVGITRSPQDQIGLEAKPPRTLLREYKHGNVEEVAYHIESGETAQGGASQSVEKAVATKEQKNAVPEAVEYLNITANNQRELDLLLQLQRDSEAASLLEGAQKQQIMQETQRLQEEEDNEQEEGEDDQDDDVEPDAVFSKDRPYVPRFHPHTLAGQFKTFPKTIVLPQHGLVKPITQLLKRTDMTHIQTAAEKAFGGKKLPQSPLTPDMSTGAFPMKPIGLGSSQYNMSEIEADAYLTTVIPPVYASVMSALVNTRKRLGTSWIRELVDRDDGQGPRVLDLGGGGAGLVAWQDMFNAEWGAMMDRGEIPPHTQAPGKKTAVVGSDNLRHRISRFLSDTTFLPRLPDYIHTVHSKEHVHAGKATKPRKEYDVIIASHAFMPLDKDWKRRELLDNLWEMVSPQGGVLIVLEKGHPRGFEAVADVRQRLLDEFLIPPTPLNSAPALELTSQMVRPQRIREPGMIVAPCTNHTKCPMYLTPGVSRGRKDFCYFSQRFIRPQFLQKLMSQSRCNHEDVEFSFLSVCRGKHPDNLVSASNGLGFFNDAGLPAKPALFLHGKEASDRAFAGYEATSPSADTAFDTAGANDASSTTVTIMTSTTPHPLSLPRNILTPLKRKGHVNLDLCTPSGTIERWTVPKSFSKQAYHDARKSQWGDLWALGAKTRLLRNVRIGKSMAEEGNSTEKTQDTTRNRAQGSRATVKARRMKSLVQEMEEMQEGKMEGRRLTKRELQLKKQSKRKAIKEGRRVKIDDMWEKMGLDEKNDDDDDEDEFDDADIQELVEGKTLGDLLGKVSSNRKGN